jgi:hypothetical protein
MCRPPKDETGFIYTRDPRGGLTRRKVDSPVPPVSPVVAPVAAPANLGVPDYGNQVIQSLQLPNNGLATIESLTASPVTTNVSDLEDPMGNLSQRVQRKKAQLSIAK